MAVAPLVGALMGPSPAPGAAEDLNASFAQVNYTDMLLTQSITRLETLRAVEQERGSVAIDDCQMLEKNYNPGF